MMNHRNFSRVVYVTSTAWVLGTALVCVCVCSLVVWYNSTYMSLLQQIGVEVTLGGRESGKRLDTTDRYHVL